MKFKNSLKKIPYLLKFYRWLRPVNTTIPLGRREGFHGNKVLQGFLREIISSLPISSYIETGIYKGISTEYIAKLNNNIPIFGCEINKDCLNQGKERLANFKNVKLYPDSSEKFLLWLTKSSHLGNLPLFYLDAHGYDYWPIEDEVDIITSFCNKAIIIIDDFEVPGQPQIGFKKRGNKTCGLELIKLRMNSKNLYNGLLPTYSAKEAFPENNSGQQLQGYIVIFQNLEDEFKSIANTFPQNHQEVEIKL